MNTGFANDSAAPRPARPEVSKDDQAARTAALDVSQSFIVQAPAGSGKTELLIQRCLALLAVVDEPEEIAAITFTRKAAAEMVERVLGALTLARGPEPDAPHRRATWRLARAVAARDATRGWHLADNPSRLRMQTIDSLSASLTRQMPLIARFGAQPAISEDAARLYADAARATLALLESTEPVADDVAVLLTHLDNNLPRATELLAAMLARRDQWLRHIRRVGQREHLEAALANIRREGMAAALAAAPASLADMLEIGAWAGGNLALAGGDSPIRALLEVDGIPGDDESDLPLWAGLAELLLTKKDGWRRRLTKDEGFPAEGGKAEKELAKSMKARLAEHIEALAGAEDFRAALANIRTLPPCEYSQAQWAVLEAIARLLPRATAELWSVFAAQGECDFAEIAQAASRALGTAEAPTDLALALDYRIRHLLVDEFQDTSFTQFELLEKLTAGWQAGDGRTLFLVGDPMQSIYRFREAEVGLFLKARARGIGGVALTPLTLSVNFRSRAGVVDWVNATFAACMPAREDITLGAVPHVRAEAFHDAAAGDAVRMHALFADQPETEAARVVSLIRAAQAERPQGSIAILVRSRPALMDIVPALKAAGLAFRAVDIDPLAGRAAVRDLAALTRALIHPADRIAWLAILRAPWCGLTLADLHALCVRDEDGREPVLWDALREPVMRLSPEGEARAVKLVDALAPVLADARRGALRGRVERAWRRLGGPATVDPQGGLEDAALYLDHLATEEEAGTLPDLVAFEQSLAQLFAAPDPTADERLVVMTLHKAKGLEFDTVIIPGLARKPRPDDRQLMTWVERVAREAGDTEEGEDGEESELLLAPVTATGEATDAISAAIRALAAQREAYERTRLLYVGATRARERLHLLATLPRKLDREGAVALKSPPAASLLMSLWSAVGAEIEAASAATPWRESAVNETTQARPPLTRLAADWVPPPEDAPDPALRIFASAAQVGETEAVIFDWASPAARHIGTVTHRWLQRIAEQGLDAWPTERIEQSRPGIARALRQLGVADDALDAAIARVASALARTLADARGRWILSTRAEAACEVRLTGLVGNRQFDAVIDRLFTDSDGTRWIIDYKTGGHEGGNVDAFLDNEVARYRPQLDRYAALIKAQAGAAPIRLALYFPLLSGWREWAAG
ncbi:MAG: UvrD-helicase domain-containing protein [Betaproteobacteria bacterium]|nr:UvrD-helicase domain-containing protein [Betaproteobacteria bacterium]